MAWANDWLVRLHNSVIQSDLGIEIIDWSPPCKRWWIRLGVEMALDRDKSSPFLRSHFHINDCSTAHFPSLAVFPVFSFLFVPSSILHFYTSDSIGGTPYGCTSSWLLKKWECRKWVSCRFHKPFVLEARKSVPEATAELQKAILLVLFFIYPQPTQQCWLGLRTSCSVVALSYKCVLFLGGFISSS